MKLLVLSHACVSPVNQAFFSDLARISGWHVDLVLPAEWDSEYVKGMKAVRWEGFTGGFHPVPVFYSGNIPLHLYRTTCIGLLRQLKPDAIYVHHEPYGLATAQMYLANSLCGRVPIGFYAAQNIFKQYPPPFRWFERLVLRHSHFCFPVTEGANEILHRKGFAGKAEVLPLALDRTVYFPRAQWAEAKRHELHIGPQCCVFGYLGRFVEEKGLELMLRAAASLSSNQEWKCLLVGGGPLEPRLRALVLELALGDRVLFVPFVPHQEVPGWLTLFDVLLLPSLTRPNWKEQFGRVIVEAHACDTMVIGSDSGEIPNVLRETGGGVVVPEGDADALGQAMRMALADPDAVKRLGLAGASAVRLRYDQEVLVRRFIEVIRNVYAGGL